MSDWFYLWHQIVPLAPWAFVGHFYGYQTEARALLGGLTVGAWRMTDRNNVEVQPLALPQPQVPTPQIPGVDFPGWAAAVRPWLVPQALPGDDDFWSKT